jgi:hypothetical protein
LSNVSAYVIKFVIINAKLHFMLIYFLFYLSSLFFSSLKDMNDLKASFNVLRATVASQESTRLLEQRVEALEHELRVSE